MQTHNLCFKRLQALGTYFADWLDIVQDNKKEFSITIVTRNLRANQGAYEYLDKVKAALTGFRVDECTKLMPTKDFFISENGGIWQYGINFSLTTTNIQNY